MTKRGVAVLQSLLSRVLWRQLALAARRRVAEQREDSFHCAGARQKGKRVSEMAVVQMRRQRQKL